MSLNRTTILISNVKYKIKKKKLNFYLFIIDLNDRDFLPVKNLHDKIGLLNFKTDFFFIHLAVKSRSFKSPLNSA